jgi:hypothetical protein
MGEEDFVNAGHHWALDHTVYFMFIIYIIIQVSKTLDNEFYYLIFMLASDRFYFLVPLLKCVTFIHYTNHPL